MKLNRARKQRKATELICEMLNITDKKLIAYNETGKIPALPKVKEPKAPKTKKVEKVESKKEEPKAPKTKGK